MNQSLASLITKYASSQTYYTIRFLADRDRTEDAYRAYAYFRWVDDILDADILSDVQRTAMNDMARRAGLSRDLEELRGMEGQAAKEYFGLMRRLLRPPSEGGSWNFDRRAYYPPPDPVNALLSFVYSLVLRDVTSACELIGLDPYLGFFHVIDYGRPSMALDLMEEFRPIVADSVVLEAVNRPFVSLVDFEQVDLTEKEEERDPNIAPRATTQATYLAASGREKVIALYENRVNDESMYQYQGQQVTYRYIFQMQAQAMARLILGEASEYLPFTVR